MDYLLQVIGHVLEHRRPADFPKQVTNTLIIRADSIESLNKVINTHVNAFLQIGGMIALKNPSDMQEVDGKGDLVGLDTRIFVPMTMLSHMETVTKPLANPVPDIDGAEEGVLQ